MPPGARGAPRRDPSLITVMGYAEEVRESEERYAEYIQTNLARVEREGIKPPQNCSACHY